MTKEERIEDFKGLCRSFSDLQADACAKWLDEIGFFDAPASTKYHGAYEGGLYDHSRAVCIRLLDLTKNNHLTWQRDSSPFIVAMLHDLCKCDQYIKSVRVKQIALPDGTMSIAPLTETYYEYNTNTILKGHGTKSIMILSQFMALTEEEMLCIRYHMGAYEKEEWAEFDMAIRKYQNVLWTHTADMLASKVDDI